jgi:hypothetical protein
MYVVEKYKRTRSWAVIHMPTEKLICVTVYKKGARSVADLLNRIAQRYGPIPEK